LKSPKKNKVTIDCGLGGSQIGGQALPFDRSIDAFDIQWLQDWLDHADCRPFEEPSFIRPLSFISFSAPAKLLAWMLCSEQMPSRVFRHIRALAV
jgi:hypothetical protein